MIGKGWCITYYCYCPYSGGHGKNGKVQCNIEGGCYRGGGMTLSQVRLRELCTAILDAETEVDWNILKSTAKTIIDYPEQEAEDE